MPYPVGSTYESRWRYGGTIAPMAPPKYIGVAKPNYVVRVQRGLIDRHYAPFLFLDGSSESFGEIAGGQNDQPWQGFWRATGPWIDVPNVQDVSLTQSLSTGSGGGAGEGVAAATIIMDNIVYHATTGLAGLFHTIRRGAMAPWYGYRGPARPFQWVFANEWFETLCMGFRIKVWHGLGDAYEPIFVGLIEDSDFSSSPDHMTLTARDFGQMLTDQRLFGWNKAREIPSPITFMDRKSSDDRIAEGHGASASSELPGFPARNVTKGGVKDIWLSTGHTAAGSHTAAEWVEVHLPKGRYESFRVHPNYHGMEMWVSVYASAKNMKGKPITVDGVPHPQGWVNVGAGSVPGGHPFVSHVPSVDNVSQVRSLRHSIVCGDDSMLRITFNNLGYSGTTRQYHAGCKRLIGYRLVRKSSVTQKHVILVDDLTDVVKYVLMWAGFHEWEIQSAGARLKDPMVFNQGDYLVDIVKRIKDQGNFVFFIGRPTADDRSIGIPVFRYSRATLPAGPRLPEVRDYDLLTAIQAKFVRESMAWIIYARGKSVAKVAQKKGGPGQGATPQAGRPLGQDPANRITSWYWPPWSGAHRDVITGADDNNSILSASLAGLWRQEIISDQNIETESQAKMMCILAALQMALAAATGQIEVPYHAGIELDEQISIVDGSTGINMRMWIVSKQAKLAQGDQPSSVMTLAGSLIDTPEIVQTAIDYIAWYQHVLIAGDK